MNQKMLIKLQQGYELWFDIIDSPIAQLWVERMMIRHAWPLDDPARFYGFNNLAIEEQIARREIQQCIQIINTFEWIVTKPFTSVRDQDFLNYLHHIFEGYHGLLDQQNTDWWNRAPVAVQKALSRLNIAVHRCESLRSHRPRFVCTWFGMPKTESLTLDQIRNHGCLNIDFGGVYLNYVEIGKTLLDLATDNDHYISDDAFRPFNHYSADFVVYFYHDDQQSAVRRVNEYYDQHRDFFRSQNIASSQDPRALPLKFKVAQLINIDDDIMDNVRQQQLIKTIEIL